MKDIDNEKVHDENSSSKKLKKLKIITLLLIAVFGIALSMKVVVNATSTNSFCATCHMMTPQALTWEASSHSSIKCKDCHIEAGLMGTIEAKIGGMYELYYMATDSYHTPIRMKSEIPDKNCQKCHNMSNRDVSASGDIIIDHDIHTEEDVSCVTCHDGVAHGKVSANKVTYRSDFDKWDEDLAAYFMDPKNIYSNPVMDKCMDCHELKGAPLTCETCHTTGMIPKDHKEANFLAKGHGNSARQDLETCNSCHSYMSERAIKGFQDKSNYIKYLEKEANGEADVMLVGEYAKVNTFCVDCHSESPDSHQRPTFFVSHGEYVGETNESCLTCHDSKLSQEKSPVTSVSCETCHPSNHKDGWQERHSRAPIAKNQKFDRTCLSCHVEETCTSCHINGRKEDQ